MARRTNKPARVRRYHVLLGRVLLAGLLLVCAVPSAVLGLHHTAKPSPQITQPAKTATPSQQSPTVTPAVPAPAPVPAKRPSAHADAALNAIITGWAAQHSFGASVIVAEQTSTLRTGSYNATASIVPASTYKLYVAYAVLHAVEQGALTLATATSDGNTVQTDLSNMIVNSDNAAARTLGFLIGWKNINALLQTQGMNNTDLYNYVPPSTDPVGDKHTTATDLHTLLTKLYAGRLLNQTHLQLLLGLMQNQHYRERIPSGVPAGIVVADKPGWLTGNDDGTTVVQNDAAIVYGPKSTYTLVITTTGSSAKPLADLSRLIYNYLQT